MKSPFPNIIEFYKQNPKQLIPIGVLVAILLVLTFGLPPEVIYAKSERARWIGMFVIICTTVVLINKSLKPFNLKKHYSSLFEIAAVLVMMVVPSLWTEVQSEKDLEENGALVKGVVYEKSYPRRSSAWQIKCSFKYQGKEYSTFGHDDVHNQFLIGDSLMIRFSKKNPGNNEIQGLTEKIEME
jgi:hypothetical protein